MALEKTRNDKLAIPEVIKKTKRNKHPTTCLSKTKGGKYFNCPFCGSENLITHGVAWSDEDPENDEHTMSADRWFSFGNKRIAVTTCADCGAVNSGRCPNCDKDAGALIIRIYVTYWQRSAWRNSLGKLACTRCNFRGGIK
jgi:predicted RNA-binding Zn-ribbon protein involved in translation (DUF1610 family)